MERTLLLHLRLKEAPITTNSAWKWGKGHCYLSKRVHQYRAAVQKAFDESKVPKREVWKDAVQAIVVACPRRKMDLDNMTKQLLDALKKVEPRVIEDDSQIVWITMKACLCRKCEIRSHIWLWGLPFATETEAEKVRLQRERVRKRKRKE